MFMLGTYGKLYICSCWVHIGNCTYVNVGYIWEIVHMFMLGTYGKLYICSCWVHIGNCTYVHVGYI